MSWATFWAFFKSKHIGSPCYPLNVQTVFDTILVGEMFPLFGGKIASLKNAKLFIFVEDSIVLVIGLKLLAKCWLKAFDPLKRETVYLARIRNSAMFH
jgi:hypothetical protein